MIAILTPYGRSDTTAAAVRLADLVMAAGEEVRLVACGRHERGVYPQWDDAVRSGRRRNGLELATHKAAAVVHFGLHRTWFERAKLASSGRQILVPNWHDLNGRDPALVAYYDSVVCPTAACKFLVKGWAFRGETQPKDALKWVLWDAGLPAVRRDGLVRDRQLTACVVCDGTSLDLYSCMVVELVDMALGAYPNLHVSILSSKSWPADGRCMRRYLVEAYPDRLTVRSVAGADLASEFHAHDWAIFPATRASFGSSVSLAMSCGAAVVCHDVEPFSSIVSQGCLVGCGRTAGLAPEAVPDFGTWLDTLGTAFSSPSRLFALQTSETPHDERRRRFDATWLRALDLA